MFEYFRLKKDLLRYKVFLLGALSDLILEFKKSRDIAKESGISQSDAVDLLNKIKNIDEKEVVSVLVDAIKSKEKTGE